MGPLCGLGKIWRWILQKFGQFSGINVRFASEICIYIGTKGEYPLWITLGLKKIWDFVGISTLLWISLYLAEDSLLTTICAINLVISNYY